MYRRQKGKLRTSSVSCISERDFVGKFYFILLLYRQCFYLSQSNPIKSFNG